MNASELLLKIAKCEEIEKALKSNTHKCHHIVSFQGVEYGSLHCPEPWSGDIEKCKVLFISSNPSYDVNDIFPTLNNFDNDKIISFFKDRFLNKIKEGHKVTRTVGSDTEVISIKYFSSIKNRFNEILGSKKSNPIDYAITEIVHCKSTNEIGVQSAIDLCSKKYLNEILRVSGAKIVVSVGAVARKQIAIKFKQNLEWSYFENNETFFLHLNHPNAREVKTIHSMYNEDQQAEIKKGISQALCVDKQGV